MDGVLKWKVICKGTEKWRHTTLQKQVSWGESGRSPFCPKVSVLWDGEFLKALVTGWGGVWSFRWLAAAKRADWQGVKPTVVLCAWEADGSLNEGIEGGGERTRHILHSSCSETVTSCVREVESECWILYYSEYQKEALSKRNQKQIDFGGICWHLYG